MLVESQRVFPGHGLGTVISHLGFSYFKYYHLRFYKTHRVPCPQRHVQPGMAHLHRLGLLVQGLLHTFQRPSVVTKTAWNVPSAICQLFDSFSSTGSSSGGYARRNMILHKAYQPWVSAETTPWGLAALRNQGPGVFSKDNTPF